VEESWRRPHNEELHTLYASEDIIRAIKSRGVRLVGHLARMRETRISYKIFVGKTEGRRPLGRPRHRWGYDIRMDLREIWWEGVNWMHRAQDNDM
jgi:hypothetical protein